MNIDNIKITIGNYDDTFETNDSINLNNSYFGKNGNTIIDVEGNCYIANFESEMTSFYDASTFLMGNVFLENSSIVPKIFVDDQLKNKILASRVKRDMGEGKYKVEFGNYPSYYDINDKSIIKKIFSKKNKTNKKITSINLETYNIYEYDNKKYIKINSSKNNNEHYYEIKPATWILNKNDNSMVFNKRIQGDIHITSVIETLKKDHIKVEESMFYNEFLKNNFLQEVLQFEPLVNQEEQIIDESNQDNKELSNGETPIEDNNISITIGNITDFEYTSDSLDLETDVITQEINSITQMIEDDVNKDKFINKLKLIIDDYNDKLCIYEESSDQVLNFGIKDESTLTVELFTELEKFKNKIIVYKNTINKYEELIAYIDEIMLIVQGKKKETNDDFQRLIYDLQRIPLTYLNDKKTNDEIEEELCNKPKKKIAKHIELLFDNPYLKLEKMDNKEELIIELRKILQPLLEKIANSVNKKSIYEDINNNFKSILSCNCAKSKYEIIDLYMNIIKSAYYEIILLANNNEIIIQEAKNIINEDIDYNVSIDAICKQLIEKYNSLRKIYYRESENQKLVTYQRRRLNLSKLFNKKNED